jgi:eukaryotic-like serine/threonine-protein kinase
MKFNFTYRSGQRVLDGFTIKRGVGQGGFGEVYFGVSDGGKEVALKLLRGHRDVELRGVANCLNLKHPNLVHVYDLRDDEHGDTWLVMEYVLGESLAQVINRHPKGLPLNLAKEWGVNLCRAINYLHDHGVVHRDVKPANVFIENGTLKVGDYGLCKSLNSDDQKLTRTVGTVFYMAPEVSTGNYTKSIDIYAIGVALYEMLTGELPFSGETEGEVLMKHLTATPDLSKVPEAFRTVVGRALEKNPLKRYNSALDFRLALEAINLSEPTSLPIAAPAPVIPTPLPVAVALPPPVIPTPEVAVPAIPLAQAVPVVAATAPSSTQPAKVVPQAQPVVETWRDRLIGTTGAMIKVPFITALALIPYAIVAQTDDWSLLGRLLLISTALSWAMIVGAAHMGYHAKDDWPARLRMLFVGALVGGLVFWTEGWTLPKYAPNQPISADETTVFRVFTLPAEALSSGLRYLLYFGVLLAIVRWWKTTAINRKERFSLFPLMVAAFWSWILLFLWPMSTSTLITGALVPMVLATVAVQVASPWAAPATPTPKKNKLQTA